MDESGMRQWPPGKEHYDNRLPAWRSSTWMVKMLLFTGLGMLEVLQRNRKMISKRKDDRKYVYNVNKRNVRWRRDISKLQRLSIIVYSRLYYSL